MEKSEAQNCEACRESTNVRILLLQHPVPALSLSIYKSEQQKILVTVLHGTELAECRCALQEWLACELIIILCGFMQEYNVFPILKAPQFCRMITFLITQWHQI